MRRFVNVIFLEGNNFPKRNAVLSRNLTIIHSLYFEIVVAPSTMYPLICLTINIYFHKRPRFAFVC
mgnify:CR=1 FL=1